MCQSKRHYKRRNDPGTRSRIRQAVEELHPRAILDAPVSRARIQHYSWIVLTHRHQASAKSTRQLVDKLGIPVYTSNMGKGIIDETNQYYVDIYTWRAPSRPGVSRGFRTSMISSLVLGNLPSDTNSGGFTRVLPENAAYVNTHDVVIN